MVLPHPTEPLHALLDLTEPMLGPERLMSATWTSHQAPMFCSVFASETLSNSRASVPSLDLESCSPYGRLCRPGRAAPVTSDHAMIGMATIVTHSTVHRVIPSFPSSIGHAATSLTSALTSPTVLHPSPCPFEPQKSLPGDHRRSARSLTIEL